MLPAPLPQQGLDRKSTRLNSSHLGISYAVFCLKKKKAQFRAGGVPSEEDYCTFHHYIFRLLIDQAVKLHLPVHFFFFFFFNDTATTEIYTLSLHDALPICHRHAARLPRAGRLRRDARQR